MVSHFAHVHCIFDNVIDCTDTMQNEQVKAQKEFGKGHNPPSKRSNRFDTLQDRLIACRHCEDTVQNRFVTVQAHYVARQSGQHRDQQGFDRLQHQHVPCRQTHAHAQSSVDFLQKVLHRSFSATFFDQFGDIFLDTPI